jgi:hypothetical protein
MIYQPDDLIVGGDDGIDNYSRIAENVGSRIVDDVSSTAQQLTQKLRDTITGARAPANVSPAPVVSRQTKISPIVMIAVGALVVGLLMRKGKR